MNQPGQSWRRVLGMLAAPVVIVLAVPLAVLAAAALYGRALVMGVVSLLGWRRRKRSEVSALGAPHFAEPARIVISEQPR